MAKTKSWGFDPSELSAAIRPQDDFYHYVNEKWLEKNPIPANESRWGTYLKLIYETDQQLRSLLKDVQSKKDVTPGSAAQMIRDFYASGIDLKRRTELGAAPLEPIRKMVRAIKNKTDLEKVIAYLHCIGVDVFWGAAIDQDEKDSEHNILHLMQDGLGMPERSYYLNDDAESKRVRDAYQLHIERMLVLAGIPKAEAKSYREIVMNIETELAKVSMKREDFRDTEKTYHKLSIAQLGKCAPQVDWAAYFSRIGAKGVTKVNVMQPEFVARVGELFETLSFEELQVYLEWHVVNDLAGALSPAFIRASFAFYGTVLTGAKQMKPLWRRILGSVNGNVSELMGQLYVEKYFPPEAKAKMNELVDDLFAAYEARIKSIDWMTPATKKKALIKLASFTRKIGYPDKWKSYKGLVISPTDYFGNLMRTNEYELKRTMKKLNKPVDRAEWCTVPQVVNAYFVPTLNDIVFPAAILQPPVFSFSADDAVNYGAIGTIIGHEITHGFDNEGSKFDSKGNFKNWWTPEDRKRFDAKAKRIENQFNQYTVVDGVKVNGKLTLGENIADLGGLSIGYDAYQLHLARTGRRDIDGFTPEQRFFFSFAVFERESLRPELIKTKVLTDPHSPGILRINGILTNFDKFYEAFNVQKGDALYRAPKDREMVW